MDYTIIVHDYGESPSTPRTHAVQETADSPLNAASLGEIEIASATWHRRYPEQGEPYDANPRMDDEWMACMESVSVLAVIEGHPKTYVEDAIYDLDEPWLDRIQRYSRSRFPRRQDRLNPNDPTGDDA